ncbi:MAG: RsmB/NOP family class I SAM-dependent RNA methyltransferase [Halobacteriaceae archaeon]
MAARDDRTAPLARYEPLVSDREAFRAACRRPLPIAVRVNTLRADPEAAVVALEDEGIPVSPVEWDRSLLELDTDSPGRTWPYVQGWIHGQELVSALPAPLVAPEPGDVVLDSCAAPGSKASHLAACMADEGTLIANDASLGRLSALRSNLDRLGVTSAVVTNRDGRHLTPDALGIDAVDATLVDAPCSCEGTIRKNPDALDNWSEAGLAELAETQTALLRRAVRLTRPGGRVVYATCTFAPEENEAVVDTILRTEACDMRRVELPIVTRPGLTEWRDTTFDQSLRQARRIYPHLNDTGGFFIAALEVTG